MAFWRESADGCGFDVGVVPSAARLPCLSDIIFIISTISAAFATIIFYFCRPAAFARSNLSHPVKISREIAIFYTFWLPPPNSPLPLLPQAWTGLGFKLCQKKILPKDDY